MVLSVNSTFGCFEGEARHEQQGKHHEAVLRAKLNPNDSAVVVPVSRVATTNITMLMELEG